ncbi:MAG TPA: LptF/LptG family permease [Verrucomicrobiae bacterium]|jgi:lipopolysaccharide export system permease protein
MKTLHGYLVRQMLATLGMTVFVFTLVLLLGNVIKQILQLLVNRQATLGVAAHGILLLIPWVLAFSLPIGMLTAALLVFGRFSADQELVAARASGVSLVSLITPVLLLSAAVSGVCAWLNFQIAPASRTAYRELLFAAETNRPAGALRSGETVPLGEYNVWVEKVAEDQTNLHHVIVVRYDRAGDLKYWAEGPEGTVERDPAHHQIVLTIHDTSAWSSSTNGPVPAGGGEIPLHINIDEQAKALLTVPISDMTFAQLREQLRNLERPLAEPVRAPKANSQQAKARRQIQRGVKDETMPVMVYMHRQVSFSFACIGFTLIGIPLGIRAHRRETSIGVATALALMLVYYSFVVLAQAWENHPERGPCIIVWLPNFIFQAVGAVLLWQANRSAGR